MFNYWFRWFVRPLRLGFVGDYPPKTSQVRMHDVRKRYPKPRLELADMDQLASFYCVGGALGKYLHGGDTPGFPGSGDIAGWLREANGQLDRAQALSYAIGIISANDRQQYGSAWAALNEALNYRGSR